VNLLKKQPQVPILSIESYKSGEIRHQLELDKKKFLIGQCEQADLNLEHEHISHYHAFLIMDDQGGGGTLIDLASDNGCYINGEKIERGYFAEGDILQFGSIEFHVVDTGNATHEIIDQDSGLVSTIDNIQGLDVPSELPPLPGLTVIDGEYCDIVFDDEAFQPLDESPLQSWNMDTNSYEEPDEIPDPEREIIPIAKESKDDSLEVTTLSCSTVLSVDYYPIKNSTLWASSYRQDKKRICIPTLKEEDEISFIKIVKGKISFDEISNASFNLNGLPLVSRGQCELNEKDTLIITQGTCQVMIRRTQSPSNLRSSPFFGRDRSFQKQTLSVFGGIMALMLLLLLVDITVDPPPEKKMAVVYRQATKAPKPVETKTASKVSEKDTPDGVKKNEQSKAPVKMAKKSSNKKKTQAKAKPQKAQAAAQKSAPSKAVKQPETKTKTYKFKSSASMASLLNKSSDSPSEIKAKSGSNTAKGLSSSSKKVAVDDSSSRAPGTLGEDFKGEYDTSSGAQGLASKRGIDTTYVDPKTVVLGSMDPELLRKILKEYLPQFRHCYQQELQRQGDHIKGVIDLNFRIGKSGQVSRVNIKTKQTQMSGSGTNCMAKVLRMIDFPSPKGDGIVDVKQPLNFQSEVSKI
jgi:hypothetical protein